MLEYTGFAEVYDIFMDNIPYDEWSAYLISLLADYDIKDGIIAELGCGTGNISEKLDKSGFDVIGIDNSEEMLAIALDKKIENPNNILYLCQDMREFELYGTVSAVVSICDSMNYLMEEKDLIEVFKLVNNYLDPNGVFIFDLNTKAKYEKIGDKVIAENREEASFIWENHYFKEDMINQYELSIFVKSEDERYDKYEEVHSQKAFEINRVEELLKESGLEHLHTFKAFTKEQYSKNDERVYIIAKGTKN